MLGTVVQDADRHLPVTAAPAERLVETLEMLTVNTARSVFTVTSEGEVEFFVKSFTHVAEENG